MNHDHPQRDAEPKGFWSSRYAIGLLVLGAIAAYFLQSEHRAVLYHAQRRNALAESGPYARIRHPQYVAFVLILLGFLLQWSTLLTLVMFPILVAMYARLAITEEVEMHRKFGAEFEAYAARTPRFLPLLRREVSAA